MRKILIATSAALALAVGPIVAAAPASAAPLQRFCYYHPYAPICFELRHDYRQHFYGGYYGDHYNDRYDHRFEHHHHYRWWR